MDNEIAAKARYVNGLEIMCFVVLVVKTVNQQVPVDQVLYNEIINRACGVGWPMIMLSNN